MPSQAPLKFHVFLELSLWSLSAANVPSGTRHAELMLQHPCRTATFVLGPPLVSATGSHSLYLLPLGCCSCYSSCVPRGPASNLLCSFLLQTLPACPLPSPVALMSPEFIHIFYFQSYTASCPPSILSCVEPQDLQPLTSGRCRGGISGLPLAKPLPLERRSLSLRL